MDKIYDRRWATADSWIIQEQIELFLNRAACPSAVPLAWNKEVLNLLTDLDKEFGIARPTSHIFGYKIHGNIFSWLVFRPLKELLSSLKREMLSPKLPGVSVVKSSYLKLDTVLSSAIGQFNYGLQCVRRRHINRIINWALKPKIELHQVKEKFGTLILHYGAPLYLHNYIDNRIKKTEVELSIKGAYMDLQALWSLTTSYHVGNDYRPDLVVSKNTDDRIVVTETCYRKAIRDAGIDVTELVKNEKKYNHLYNEN